MENSKEFESLFFETKKVDCARDVFKPSSEDVFAFESAWNVTLYFIF
jgi:hypothetical protein